MAGRADLTIRQFERNEVVLEGEFEVAPADRAQVIFSARHAAVIDAHTIRMTVSDIGAGGIGFQSPLFLPRMLRGTIRILEPIKTTGQMDTHSPRCVAFEHAVRIRRVDLTSRIPSYFIGSSFEAADAQLDEALTAMMDRISETLRSRAAQVLSAGVPDEPENRP